MANLLANKYTITEVAKKFEEYGLLGKSVTQLARDLNVGRRTLYSWVDKYDTIREAHEVHQTMYVGYLENMVEKSLTGEIELRKDQLASIFSMLRRYDEQWKDTALKGNVIDEKEDEFANMSEAELEAEFQRLKEKGLL